MSMWSAIFGVVFVGGLALGPVIWRVRQDRLAERALAVRAVIHAAVVRALGGESLVSVNVRPPSLWRPGRVELAAPNDWRFLLEPAWTSVMPRVPADYELVVTPVTGESGLSTEVELPRAA